MTADTAPARRKGVSPGDSSTTDRSPEPIVAAALNHAANLIDSRHYVKFSGGPELWTGIHAAATDMIAGPAAEHLRRHLGTRQLQHWDGTQAEAVAALRAAAADAPVLADAQADAALADMEQARALLRHALNSDGIANDEGLGTLAHTLNYKTRQFETAQAQWEEYAARLRNRISELEGDAARLARELREARQS